ncbi:MAG: hypothetical protein KDC87_03090 [Planctomycetes bacterium]|nr:hypothetical protein [Planctomycetota bacterium]
MSTLARSFDEVGSDPARAQQLGHESSGLGAPRRQPSYRYLTGTRTP